MTNLRLALVQCASLPLDVPVRSDRPLQDEAAVGRRPFLDGGRAGHEWASGAVPNPH